MTPTPPNGTPGPAPRSIRAIAEHFLGARAAAALDQPEAILDVPLGTREPDLIRAALQRQLARIRAKAPEGGPAAQQAATLVERAAAGVLGEPSEPIFGLEPDAGDSGAERPQPVTTSPGPIAVEPLEPAPRPAAARPSPAIAPDAPAPGASDVPPALETLRIEATRMLASGGLDVSALQQLTLRARMLGLPPSAVTDVTRALAARGPAPAPRAPVVLPPRPALPLEAPPPPAPAPTPPRLTASPQEALDRVAALQAEQAGRRATRQLALGVVVAFVVFVVGVAALLIILISGGRSPAANANAGPSAAAPAAASSPPLAASGTTSEPPAAAPSSARTAPAPSSASSAPPSVVVAPRPGPLDATRLRAELRQAAAGLATGTQASLAAYDQAIIDLAASWPALSETDRTATVESIVDFLFAALGRDGAAEHALGLLLEQASPLSAGPLIGPDAVLPAAFSTGVLARLLRESDLPRDLAEAAAQSLRQAVGGDRSATRGSFSLGALAAMRGMPLRITGARDAPPAGRPAPDDADAAFAAWERGLTALTDRGLTQRAASTAQAQGFILDGIERVMIDGPEPDADRVARQVISGAAARLKWGAEDPARARLLRWFDDARISAADLHAITAALLTKTNADGVDLSLLVPSDAKPELRRELRTAYSAAWALGGGVDASPGAAAGASQSWHELARAILVEPAPTTGVEQLRRAAVIARLNESAWRRWRGDVVGARDAHGRLLADAQAAASLPTPTGLFTFTIAGGAAGESASDWAFRYLTGDRAPAARLERLREAAVLGDALTQADADVLAEVALLSSPGELRKAATAAVQSLADHPRMVNAGLRLLPRTPRTRSNGALIERLAGRPFFGGGWQSEAYWIDARRGLVERLLEMLAASAPNAADAPPRRLIDRLAVMLALAHAASAGVELTSSIGGGPPVDEDAAEATLAASTALARMIRDQGDRFAYPGIGPRLDEIDSLARARRDLARGPVQRVVAEQAAAVDALAYLVLAEQPTRAVSVNAIASAVAVQRREAGTVFEQLMRQEEAMLRLWLVRLGLETPA